MHLPSIGDHTVSSLLWLNLFSSKLRIVPTHCTSSNNSHINLIIKNIVATNILLVDDWVCDYNFLCNYPCWINWIIGTNLILWHVFNLQEIDVYNLICLYGKHERLLNNFVLRFENKLIPDLFKYFRQSWCYGIFHDYFNEVQKQNVDEISSIKVKK